MVPIAFIHLGVGKRKGLIFRSEFKCYSGNISIPLSYFVEPVLLLYVEESRLS